MSVKKLISLFLMLAFISLTILIMGNSIIFISFPSMLIVAGLTIGMAFVAFRPSEIFPSIFGKTQHNLNYIAIDFFGNSFILAGAAGTFIGLLMILAYLDKAEDLIPGLAMSSLTLIYGFILKFITDSFKSTSSASEIFSAHSINKNNISPVHSILGIIFFIVIFLQGIFFDFALFFNPAAFVICICGGLVSVFVTNTFQNILDSLKGGFGGMYSTVDEAKNAVRVTSNMYNKFISFGFIGLMIGIYKMFTGIENPEQFGPGMALALMSFLYAILCAMICLAFGTAARRQVTWFGEDEKPDFFMSPAASGLFSLALVLVAFAVLLGSFSKN